MTEQERADVQARILAHQHEARERVYAVREFEGYAPRAILEVVHA